MNDEAGQNDGDGRAFLTLTEAARATRKSVRTIQRWVKRGRLSVLDTPEGRRVQLCDLLRLAPVNGDVSHDTPGHARHSDADTSRHQAELLRVKLDAAEQALADRTREVEWLRQQNERLTILALGDGREKQSRRWWRFWRS